MGNKSWYDTKTLFSEADGRVVVKSLFDSCDFKMSGSTLFCRCPSGHKETQLNHCAVYKDGCKCFSCGERYGIKEMVEKYYALKGRSLSFLEICELIADTCGGKDRYLIKKDTKKPSQKKLPLSREELAMIGITSPEWEKDVPKMSVFYKNDEKLCLAYLTKKAETVLLKLQTLKNNDNENIVKEACRREIIIKDIIKKLSPSKPGV